MTANLLVAESISKAFGGVKALTDVSVEFRRGEVHGLVGPNGSGKSTLLSIISGALAADSGLLRVGGTTLQAISSPRLAGRLGIHRMPQELALVPSMTVFDNVVLGYEPSRRPGAIRSARAHAGRLLDKIGLFVDLEIPAAALRPSQQRLLMLARTMYRDAEVIIADEPTAGLIPADARHVTDALAGAARHGACVIFVSHHLSEVARVAHRVTLLRDGQVAARFDGAVDRAKLIEALLDGAQVDQASGGATAGPGPAALTVRSLSAGAVHDLDLTARRHEIVGIAGLFGSGREHVLPAIVGDLSRRAGMVATATGQVHNPRSALRHKVGYLNGDRTRAVVPGLTVAEHTTMPIIGRLARLGWIRKAAEKRAVTDTLGRVSVTASPHQPLRTLSGGNQQRALLARWLLAEVDVLLVDEPAVGVDIRARHQLLQELRRFAEHGAVVVASSDNDDLLEICDRIICLKDGRVATELAGNQKTSAAIADAIT